MQKKNLFFVLENKLYFHYPRDVRASPIIINDDEYFLSDDITRQSFLTPRFNCDDQNNIKRKMIAYRFKPRDIRYRLNKGIHDVITYDIKMMIYDLDDHSDEKSIKMGGLFNISRFGIDAVLIHNNAEIYVNQESVDDNKFIKINTERLDKYNPILISKGNFWFIRPLNIKKEVELTFFHFKDTLKNELLRENIYNYDGQKGLIYSNNLCIVE